MNIGIQRYGLVSDDAELIRRVIGAVQYAMEELWRAWEDILLRWPRLQEVILELEFAPADEVPPEPFNSLQQALKDMMPRLAERCAIRVADVSLSLDSYSVYSPSLTLSDAEKQKRQ